MVTVNKLERGKREIKEEGLRFYWIFKMHLVELIMQTLTVLFSCVSLGNVSYQLLYVSDLGEKFV